MTACFPKLSAQIAYGPLQPGEERAVIKMVLESFDAAVAPLYCGQGVAEFKKYAGLKEMAFRCASAHPVLAARSADLPVGMIELCDRRHISMFFVRTGWQGCGIGRQLLLFAESRCRAKNPAIENLSVNASPNAVPAYRRLGFAETGPEKIINGIRYVPMQRNLTRID